MGNQPLKRNASRPWAAVPLKLIVIAVFCVLSGYSLVSCTSSVDVKPEGESPFKPQVTKNDVVNIDFSEFKHESEQHQKTPCLICHVREDKSSEIKLAGHTSCNSCHAQQMADNSSAICTSCHTESGTEELKPVPALKTFKTVFDHELHFKETSCTTCHKTERRGGMTVPAGSRAHSNCFECHTPERVVGDRNIGSCSTCHQQGEPVRIVDATMRAGFRFTHASHRRVSCQSCHGQASGNKMTATRIAMHGNLRNSCATCHNERRAFGSNDFSDCRKCHTEVARVRSFGVRFNHARHARVSCSKCHTDQRGGNLTIPNGIRAHSTCYQCHSPKDKSPRFESSQCFQCHKIGQRADIRPAARTLSYNFTHRGHSTMSCSECHAAGNRGVSAPTVAMHSASNQRLSCATCHNEKRAFGGENFADCKRCHTGGNFNGK